MKLPNFKRINKSDFPKEFSQLIELLASLINNTFDSIYNLTNRNISLRDNIYCQVKEIDVTVDGSGDPLTVTGFTYDLRTKPEGLIVIQATNLTNSNIYPNSGIFVSYSINNTQIQLDNITGLPANNTFRLKVVLFG